MYRRRLIGVVSTLWLAVSAAGRVLPTACPTARYVVTAGAEQLAGGAAGPVVIVMAAREATVSGGCSVTRTRVRVRRSGTRLLATFAACGPLTNVRVRAVLPPACDALTGTLRAKRTKRAPFAAARSRCGDQIVDAGNGEECDGSSCSGERACTACSCSGGGAGDCSTTAIPTTAWVHVPIDSTIDFAHNPPTSGPHYPVWARYQVYPSTVPRGYWVHNLEHGGVVLVYRPDADPRLIDGLLAAYATLPVDPACGHRRALVTPDPLLVRPFVVVAANVELACAEVDPQAIRAFTAAHRGNGPENVCADGSYQQ